MTDRIYKSFGEDQQPWMASAACANTDADMFPGRKERELRPARAVCATCPQATRTACLTYAITEGLTHGVYGGASPDERRAMLRRAGK